jgi:hypothetical protein
MNFISLMKAAGLRGTKARNGQQGYYRHSLAETTMFRYKTILSDHLRARTLPASKPKCGWAAKS